MLPFCAICFKEITDNICTAMGRRFHTNCFRCIICKRPLSGAEFRLGPGPEWEVRPFEPNNVKFQIHFSHFVYTIGVKGTRRDVADVVSQSSLLPTRTVQNVIKQTNLNRMFFIIFIVSTRNNLFETSFAFNFNNLPTQVSFVNKASNCESIK